MRFPGTSARLAAPALQWKEHTASPSPGVQGSWLEETGIAAEAAALYRYREVGSKDCGEQESWFQYFHQDMRSELKNQHMYLYSFQQHSVRAFCVPGAGCAPMNRVASTCGTSRHGAATQQPMSNERHSMLRALLQQQLLIITQPATADSSKQKVSQNPDSNTTSAQCKRFWKWGRW